MDKQSDTQVEGEKENQIDRGTDGWTYILMVFRTNGWIDRDRQMDEEVDGGMGGWADGWIRF